MAKPTKHEPGEDNSFLSRWSKRKRMASTDRLDDTDPEPDGSEERALQSDADAPGQSAALSEEEIAALPAPETFTPETDIRPFLRPGVPHSLRNAALRKMWMLTPAIRDHSDPAVDYAWDWNTPGGVPGDGAAPSLERAAQMLKDLVAPRHDTTLRDAENSDEAHPNDTGSAHDTPADSATLTEPKLPEPVRVSSKPVESVSEATQSTDLRANDAPAPVLRRHGGAMPY